MSLASLDKSVGKGGVNKFDDVVLVQFLLNKHIMFGSLHGLSVIMPGTAITSSENDPTIRAIKAFQDKLMGTSNPDGRVDPNGKTIKKLRESSKSPADVDALIMAAKDGLAKGSPASSIAQDLWEKTMLKLIQFADEPLLKRTDIVTIVDFRLRRTADRLWTVGLRTRDVTGMRVAHGSGSGGEIPTSFSNVAKTNKSSVGSYVTMHSYPNSTLGSLEKLGLPEKHTGMVVHGLEKSNSNANNRGIRFHAAWYVGPNKLTSDVGNSHGCFATHVDNNGPLIDKIQGGSFLFAYAGEKHM